MAHADTFHCTVVTPERSVLDAEARFVAFPAHDGEIGILARRAPLLVRVGVGPLRAESAAGTEVLLIDGGFAQMVDDRLTILTEAARRPEELDAAAARAALAAAKAMPIGDERSFKARQHALARARAELRMAGGG